MDLLFLREGLAHTAQRLGGGFDGAARAGRFFPPDGNSAGASSTPLCLDLHRSVERLDDAAALLLTVLDARLSNEGCRLGRL
jgi:hypothetical protein